MKTYFKNGIIEVIGIDILITVDGFSTISIPMSREESAQTYINALEKLVLQGKAVGKRLIRAEIRETLGV